MDDATQSTRKRIFIGLKVNSEIANELAALAAALKDTPARRVAAPDIHLTLVPPWQENLIDQAIGKLRQVAAQFMPFTLKLQHLGYGLQPRRPTLLWVDCAATNEIATLHAALMQTFGQEDNRPFRPHVTLARIRPSGQYFSRRHPIERYLDFEQVVRTVELFQSPPPGATGYQILASVELGGSDPSGRVLAL